MDRNTQPVIIIGAEDSKDATSIASKLKNSGIYAAARPADPFELIYAIKSVMPDALVLIEKGLPFDIAEFAATLERRNAMLPIFVIGEDKNGNIAKIPGTIIRSSADDLASDIRYDAKNGAPAESNATTGTESPASSQSRDLFIERSITETIKAIGIPANIKGYRYIRTALMLAVANPDILESVTKDLYPSVAKTHQTTPSRAERAIRHAIELTFERATDESRKTLHDIFLKEFDAQPTNSEFIASIADYISLEAKGLPKGE